MEERRQATEQIIIERRVKGGQIAIDSIYIAPIGSKLGDGVGVKALIARHRAHGVGRVLEHQRQRSGQEKADGAHRQIKAHLIP